MVVKVCDARGDGAATALNQLVLQATGAETVTLTATVDGQEKSAEVGVPGGYGVWFGADRHSVAHFQRRHKELAARTVLPNFVCYLYQPGANHDKVAVVPNPCFGVKTNRRETFRGISGAP